MADNVTLNVGTGGSVVRAVNKGGVDTGVSLIDVGGGGAEALLSAANPMPIAPLAAGTALVGQVAAAMQTGQLYAGVTPLTPQFAPVSASASGDGNVVVAAQAGKKIRVLYYSVQVGGAATVKFRDFDGTSAYSDLTGPHALLANQPMPGGSYLPVGHFTTQAGHALTLNLSAAVPAGGHVVYTVE